MSYVETGLRQLQRWVYGTAWKIKLHRLSDESTESEASKGSLFMAYDDKFLLSDASRVGRLLC